MVSGGKELKGIWLCLNAFWNCSKDFRAVVIAAIITNVGHLMGIDSYSVTFQGAVMAHFAQHYPHTELRCGPAEDADVIE